MTDYGFERVSTGSQDAASQRRDIRKESPDAIMISADTKSASASKGEHLDAMDKLIAKLVPGDRVIVTGSSRLDRDPDQWAQMARLISIKAKGAEVVDLSNPSFGSSDRFGVVMTALHQMENADKSRTVKNETWRGVQTIITNNAFFGGGLPAFWASSGERYSKQAACTDPAKVQDIYQRVADGKSLHSIGRAYNMYPYSIRVLVRFAANHTGVINCQYTHDGVVHQWTHKVLPVVASSLWWQANKRLNVLAEHGRKMLGGRPVSQATSWISGVLDCPECGGHLYLNAGHTPAGNPRTPVLRCGGLSKGRKACGKFTGCDARPVLETIENMFISMDDTAIMAYQRVTGNGHELDELQATLARLQGALSSVTDRQARREAISAIEAAEDAIEAFELVTDSYDYAPTGQTVAEMWLSGDDAVKRSMTKAVKNKLGLDLNPDQTGEDDRIYVGVLPAEAEHDGIVDLGGGICFRRNAA